MQLADILSILRPFVQECNWYVHDLNGSSEIALTELFPEDSKGIRIVTSTEMLIEKVKEVNQFESGVFIAISNDKYIKWDDRELPETEEEEGLQHSSAKIEIRAFDFSYYEIYGTKVELKEMIEQKLLLNLERGI